MGIPASASIWTDFLALQGLVNPSSLYETRMINDSSGKILYLGTCITPNGDTSLPIWNVIKFGYDGNGILNRQQLPDNGSGWLYIWDDVQSDYFS